MPYFLLTFGDASGPPVGAVIIDAPSMFEVRVAAVVRRLPVWRGPQKRDGRRNLSTRA